jgi:hypothetical protein
MFGFDLHTIRCYLTQKQECVWFKCWDLNSFRNIWARPVEGVTGVPRMVMTYIPSDAPCHKEQECIQFRGGEINGFQDINKFPLLCSHPTPGENEFYNLANVLYLKTFM